MLVSDKELVDWMAIDYIKFFIEVGFKFCTFFFIGNHVCKTHIIHSKPNVFYFNLKVGTEEVNLAVL